MISAATIFHNPFGDYKWDDGVYSKAAFMWVFRDAFPEYADLPDGELWGLTVRRYQELKSWVREDKHGSPPRAIPVRDQPRHYRLTPPPACLGRQPA
jgi:hypothetical protein